MERYLITSAVGLVLIGIFAAIKYLILKNEIVARENGTALTVSQIKSHAKATWLIIPVSLVFSFLSDRPSSSNGAGAGLLIIGFLVFLFSSIFLAIRAWRGKKNLGLNDIIIAYSPIVVSLFLLSLFFLTR